MKRYVIGFFSLVSRSLYIEACQDRPALTKAESVFYEGVTLSGQFTGSFAGGMLGMKAGKWASSEINMGKVEPKDKKLMKSFFQWKDSQPNWDTLTPGQRSNLLGTKFTEKKIGIIQGYLNQTNYVPGVSAGTYMGLAAGTVLGRKGAKNAALFILAKRHNVSIPIERISIEYDVNIEQYRPLLEAAERKNAEQLRAVIQEIFPKRFGKNWERYFNLLGSYPNQLRTKMYLDPEFIAKIDFRYGSLNPQIAAWFAAAIRILRLGAAMAHLYEGTQQGFIDTTWIPKALSLYQMLGFIPQDATSLSIEEWKEALRKELE